MISAHVISAWACDQQLVSGQRKIDDKSNEITAIPELLALLALKGAIVTIDAMGCQRRICRQIIDQQADYVIGLKGNQGSLRDDVELFPEEHPERDIGGEFIEESEAVDADHGRIETRRYTVCSNVEWLTDRHKWPGLPGPKAVIMTGYTRQITGKAETVRQLYISYIYLILPCFLAAPEKMAQYIRNHRQALAGGKLLAKLLAPGARCYLPAG